MKSIYLNEPQRRKVREERREEERHIATLSSVLPVAVITQDGEIYPVEWVQGDDNN